LHRVSIAETWLQTPALLSLLRLCLPHLLCRRRPLHLHPGQPRGGHCACFVCEGILTHRCRGRVTQSGSFPTGAAKCTQTSWRDWCHSRRPKADRESRGKCTMIWIPAFAGMTIDIARLSRCHSDERGQTHAGCVICPRGSSRNPGASVRVL
jgi:hypothetical protein